MSTYLLFDIFLGILFLFSSFFPLHLLRLRNGGGREREDKESELGS